MVSGGVFQPYRQSKGSDADDSGAVGGNTVSAHKSGLGGPNNNTANTNKEWQSRFRRRRKDDEGGGSGSARSSNSSVSANTSGHYPSGRSPLRGQVSPSGVYNIDNKNQLRNDSSAAQSNQVAGSRGLQQSHQQAQSVQSPPQQHFDLEASSFPPLPVPDQSTNLVVSQTATVHNPKNNGGSSSVADVVASDAVAKATVVGASAWGENRLADVVKGTAKTAKSSKNTATTSDKDANVTGNAVIDDIPVVSASSKAPTSQINQTATASSTPSNASKSKTVESGDETNVISMAKPSSQRHDTLYAHQTPRSEQQSSNLANNTDVTAAAAAAADWTDRKTKTIPAGVVSNQLQTAPQQTTTAPPPPTLSADSETANCQNEAGASYGGHKIANMSNIVPHPNTKNNPVIKHLNAEISTKTDGSLVNGIDDNSGNHALTNSTENLTATGGATHVRNTSTSSTRNAATMTIGTTEVTVASSTAAPTAFASVAKSEVRRQAADNFPPPNLLTSPSQARDQSKSGVQSQLPAESSPPADSVSAVGKCHFC